MSAIGDYIHLNINEYKNKGPFKEKGDNNWAAIAQDRKKEILKTDEFSLSSKELEILKDYIKLTREHLANDVELQKQIEEAMKKDFEDSMKNIEIDWKKLNVTDTSTLPHLGRFRQKNSKTFEDVEARIQKFIVIMSKLSTDFSAVASLGKDLSQLETDFEDINKLYDEVEKLNQTLKDKNTFWEDFAKPTREKNGQYSKSIMGKLNSYIKIWAGYPPLMLQKGSLFEQALALVPTVVQKHAEKEIQEMFKEANVKVMGGEHEQVKFDNDKFAQEYIDDSFKDVLCSTSTSQGKIDVQLKMNGKEVNISAKNINLEKAHTIHLVEDTSLLFLLHDEDPVYVNHFLNLVAQHYGENGKEQQLGQLKDRKQEMLNDLRKILLYKALSGNYGGRKTVNLFVVNDSSSNGVYIYTLNDIVKKIENTESTKRLIHTPELPDTIVFKNDKEGKDHPLNDQDAMKRISKLLALVHNKKITVGFDPSIIK